MECHIVKVKAHMVCKQITIHGRVQGVSFRISTKEKADELGLTGEVRNLPGGNGVEVLVCGEAGQVERLVEWCRVGPRLARVEKVFVSEVVEREFAGFSVVRR